MKVYLDNAATTKIHPRVLEKMIPFLSENYGNPSSVHSFGRKARVAIEDSRELIANFINADPSEIYFTSCGTESNNFIINGIVQTEFLETGRNHIVTSSGDHKAVLNAFQNLDKNGFNSSIIPIDKHFKVNSEKLNSEINPKTSFVSLIHVNNETGTINPIDKIKNELEGTYFHSDTVQSFGKFNLDVKELGVHSISASAHKIYGPKGIGLAYVKNQTPMSSLFFGGGQERNRRAGTENVASIVGFAEAVKIAKEYMNHNFEKVKDLNKYFCNCLLQTGIEGIINNSSDTCSSYILSLSLQPELYHTDTEAILMYLDINGIAASAGSACTSGTLKPSHVILAGGYSNEYAKGTLRFSFSSENTFEEIDYTIDVLKNLTVKIRK